MAKATVVFQSDDKDVLASIEKMNAKLAEMQAKIAAGNEKANSGFNGVVTSLSKMALGYLSINTALQVGNQMLRDRIELQEKARDKQLTAAAGEREFQLNQGFVQKEVREANAQGLEEIARRRGVSMATARSVAGNATASANGNFPAMLQATDLALGLQPYDVGTASELAGASLRLSAARGKIDPEQGFKSLVEIGASSSIKNWQQMAQYAPRGIGAAVSNQFSPDAAEAMFIALTKAGDTEGSNSATAQATFSARIRDFLPEKDTYTVSPTGKQTLKARGTGLTSGDARLQKLLDDPQLRTRFLSTLEASTDKAYIEQLLTPGSIINDTYKQQLAKSGQGLVGANEFSAQMNESPLQKTAELNRRLERPSENSLEGNTSAARYAIVRDNLDKLYQSHGFWSGSRFGKARAFDIAGMAMPAEEAGIEMLKDYGQKLNIGQSGIAPGDRETYQRQMRDVNEQMNALKKSIAERDGTGEVVNELKAIKQNQRAAGARQHVEGR